MCIRDRPLTDPQIIVTDAGGIVTLNPDGTFTYTPPADYTGADIFDYSIVDSNGAVDTASVTLNVVADPDPDSNNDPFAGNDLLIASVDQPATGNLLDNDTDPNSDPLVIADINGQDPSSGPITITDPITGDPAGTVEVDPVTGEMTFTPEPGFTGTVQVPYTIDDGSGGQGSSSVTIAITDTDPVVVDDTANTDAGVPTSGNVLANGSDENPLDTLTILCLLYTSPSPRDRG